MDVDKFTRDGHQSLREALRIAEVNSHPALLPIHLAQGLLEPVPLNPLEQRKVPWSSRFSEILGDAGGDVAEFRKVIKTALSRLPTQHPRAQAVSFSPSLTQILRNAIALTEAGGDKLVNQNHLIWCIVQDPEIRGLLRDASTKNTDYLKELLGLESKPAEDVDSPETDSTEDEYTIILTLLAKNRKIDPVIGRDEEIRRLITILLHRTRNNPILVGERGIGKTSIVKGLAQRIIAGDVPSVLADWRILSLDSGSLTSDVDSKDKLEERVSRILR
jgi:ATP-dependent Clp protease ATP-binding subunit ClpB